MAHQYFLLCKESSSGAEYKDTKDLSNQIEFHLENYYSDEL